MRHIGSLLLHGFRALLSHKLGQIAFGIAAAFVLFGAVMTDRIFLALVLLVCIRLITIVNEAVKKRYTSADWHARYQQLVDVYSRMTAQEFAEEIDGLNLTPPPSPHQLARAIVSDEQQVYVEPRRPPELLIEGLGLIALVLLAPLTIAFHAREFVSLRGAQDWLGLLTILSCVALYLWPLRWPSSDEQAGNRTLWWGLPILPVLSLFYTGLARHPYLDPTVPNQQQLAADKVLALPDNVMAASHSDWVFEYAQALERDNTRAAIDYYQRGLKLAPQAGGARERLTDLQAKTSTSLTAFKNLDRHRPYWRSAQPVPALPACRVDATIKQVPSTTLVLIRSGAITRELVNQVGDVLERELNVPVCAAEVAMLLPTHSRRRGLVIGRQWDVASLAASLDAYLDPIPLAPLKFLLLTDVDIYSAHANFVFSVSYEWGAIVSTAKFSEISNSSLEFSTRTVKQALGAILKSFDVPPSDDPNCVTSYTNGLDQFDAKGNYPNETTLARFRQALDSANAQWQASSQH